MPYHLATPQLRRCLAKQRVRRKPKIDEKSGGLVATVPVRLIASGPGCR